MFWSLLASVAALNVACASSSDASFTRLHSWVLSQGGGANVRMGFSSEGLRGLVADRACAVGDVLLEVPLSLCISDGSDDDGSAPLAGAAPRWTWTLPWNVQLAMGILHRQRAGADLDPFLESWPATPPPLPTTCEAAELALASDPSLADKADEAFFWLDQQYWRAREAAAQHRGADAADADDNFPTPSRFRSAMELVWSRCLRASTAEHGVRRVLVPLLDLANHEACPTAMYAFASGASCGPAIRLHAVRALDAGEAVTITYGEHSSTHFALYYGFVPDANPADSITVTLSDVLSTQPSSRLGPEPTEGWSAAIDAALAAGGAGDGAGDASAQRFPLFARAPSGALLRTLRALLPGGDAAAARAIATTAAAIERSLWGLESESLDDIDGEAAAAADDDEELLRAAGTGADQGHADADADGGGSCAAMAEGGGLTERGGVLVRLRLSRRRLLASVRRTMLAAAETCDTDAEEGARILDTLARSADAPPPTYPGLDALPVEELSSWAEREWDWAQLRWAQ